MRLAPPIWIVVLLVLRHALVVLPVLPVLPVLLVLMTAVASLWVCTQW
jgi:hypothetical protein